MLINDGHPEGGGPVTAPLKSQEGELLALINDNAHRSQGITLFGAALIAGILALHTPFLFAAGWWVVLAATVVLRTRYLARASSAASEERPHSLTVWAFAATAAAQASLMLFFQHVPIVVGTMITTYLVAVVAGMVASTAGGRRVVDTYSFIVLGAVCVGWALSPHSALSPPDRMILIGIVVTYGVALRLYSGRAYQVFAESYQIRMERVEFNTRLREALDKAEIAIQSKTRFLAAASHDLRQPIHALALFSGSLLLRDLDARTASIAAQIDKSVQVLGSQLDALLDISRLDAGVVERATIRVDLGLAFEQLDAQFRPQAERKGLVMRSTGADGVCVRTDPALLMRILGNLMSNAIKYTVAGEISLEATCDGGVCRVSVRDTGPGIPDSERERIFEEFYQIENPERDREKGLGLGLSIVQRLCALLEIRLHLHSALGKGSEFGLDLPFVRQPESSTIFPDLRPAGSVPRLRVLIIDDEEQVRLGTQTLLEEMGFEVESAASTESALSTSRKFRPAVVLADFRLRGGDTGLQAIRALREYWPHLPALLISGDTAPDRLREARDSGLELLHKPVRAEILRESILRVAA